MITFKTAAMVSTLIYVALPLSASANPNVMDTKPIVSASVSTTVTQQQPARIVKAERMVREVVLSSGLTVSKVESYPVQNNEGETFINHNLTTDELSPVTTNIQFNDTYEFEHNGKIYQNKTVL